MSGFAKTVQTVSVTVGQTAQLDVALEISKAAETIEVSGAAPLISTEPGTATSYTPEEVALLPTAGGDITTLAFTSPGVVVAPGSGYGNFTVNGLPGTSNLYTVNGENDMDPYFNINNSGATNLTLGSNEVQEATIVTNPYSGEYGQLSGAQVNYVTKSGTNSFHGNAQYWWNGREMNANDFISNASGCAAPILECQPVGCLLWRTGDQGSHLVLCGHRRTALRTAQRRHGNDTDDSVCVGGIGERGGDQSRRSGRIYQHVQYLCDRAAGKQVSPIAPAGTECAGITLAGFPTGAPCQETVTLTPTSFAKEWILAGRIDQKLTSKDDLFFRFKIGLRTAAHGDRSFEFGI